MRGDQNGYNMLNLVKEDVPILIDVLVGDLKGKEKTPQEIAWFFNRLLPVTHGESQAVVFDAIKNNKTLQGLNLFYKDGDKGQSYLEHALSSKEELPVKHLQNLDLWSKSVVATDAKSAAAENVSALAAPAPAVIASDQSAFQSVTAKTAPDPIARPVSPIASALYMQNGNRSSTALASSMDVAAPSASVQLTPRTYSFVGSMAQALRLNMATPHVHGPSKF